MKLEDDVVLIIGWYCDDSCRDYSTGQFSALQLCSVLVCCIVEHPAASEPTVCVKQRCYCYTVDTFH